MKTATINVVGMTCGGCVGRVKHALMALAGMQNVAVELHAGEVKVTFDETKVTTRMIGDALGAAGYRVATARVQAEPAGCCGART